MKINVLDIMWRHVRTLRDAQSGRILIGDLFLFFGIPFGAGCGAGIFVGQLSDQVVVASLTVFAIFAALLLNVQIAVFGIFQREWQMPMDDIQADARSDEKQIRAELIKELNTNISYFIVMTCICLTLFLAFLTFSIHPVAENFLAFFVYTHFLLTLLMIVKRAHTVFEKEYQR